MKTSYQEERKKIVGELEQSKVELRSAMNDLTATVKSRYREVRESVDLGRRVSDRPLPWLLGSFGLGLVLGTRAWFQRKLRRAG